MLKIFRNSTAAIRLYRCQRYSHSILKLSTNQIHPQGYLQCSFPLPNYYNVANSLSVLSRSYCSIVDLDDDNDNENLEKVYDELPQHLDDRCMQIKNFLYKHLSDDDELLNKIKICESEDILLRAFNDNMERISRHHTVLFAVQLWYCNNPKFKLKIAKSNEDIKLLLDKILHHVGDMSLDELSVCFLFLTKLSVNMQTDVTTTILELILKHLKNDESVNCSLGGLSRFAVAVNLNPQLYGHYIGQNIIPHILFHLDRVTTSHELRLLTICLINLRKLVSTETISLVEKKIYQFIEEGKLEDDKWAILKILQFLCFPYWSQGDFVLIRVLLLELQDKIPTFNARELELAGTLSQLNFEPAPVISTIAARALELLESGPFPDILPLTIFYSTPENRQHITKLVEKYLVSNPHPDAADLKILFKTLRHLRTSDLRICNVYWSKVTNSIMSNQSQQQFHILSRHCHRYMHFNNNLNGTYRHIPFEKELVNLLVKDLHEGITALIPSRFTKAASFILAYGHTSSGRNIFPEFIVRKIETMQEQFSISDCLQLTRGIQVAFQMRFYRDGNPVLAQQIVRLENVFNACTERHLDQPKLTLSGLNSVIRSYSNRKSETKTSVYRKIIEKYETILHEPLNSRIIRDITFNLNKAKYNVPLLCNSINEYMVKNREFVLGDTVQKVLYCFYNLNYYPKDETIFECAIEAINRDFNIMTGLAVVEGCLALAYFKALPGSLIDRVFNISFIQRVEDEIEQCYSKDFYPQRVLNSVMQLNRSVCLDYPENRVPWFQQNYIEAQLSNRPAISNRFHTDVKQVLLNYVTDEKLLKVNHITPYGYRIDFVFYIDANKNLMIPPDFNDTVLHVDKIAILLLNTDSMCQNDSQNMRGKQVLKERHLEIMGFKVVQINYIQWNSMYMCLPGAKIDYVKGLLSC